MHVLVNVPVLRLCVLDNPAGVDPRTAVVCSRLTSMTAVPYHPGPDIGGGGLRACAHNWSPRKAFHVREWAGFGVAAPVQDVGCALQGAAALERGTFGWMLGRGLLDIRPVVWLVVCCSTERRLISRAGCVRLVDVCACWMCPPGRSANFGTR